MKKIEETVTKITQLTIEEAKAKSNVLLEDSAKFKCVRSTVSDSPAFSLAQSLMDFFSAYESVEAVAGEGIISKKMIMPSEYQRGFLRIGTDSDFTELAVRSNEDQLYQIDGSERTETDFRSSQLPSIYHWVLVTDFVLYGGK
jgi:hypothetical protein